MAPEIRFSTKSGCYIYPDDDSAIPLSLGYPSFNAGKLEYAG